MPYHYRPKTVFLSHLLEAIAFLVLLPLQLFKRKRIKNVTKILLIEPFQMGDVVSLFPMITPLKKAFPEGKIYILTKPSSGAVAHLDQRITHVFTTDFPWSDYGYKKSKLSRLWQLTRFLWRLRKEKFDLGIDTRGDVRSQAVLQFIGCKQVVGYQHYLGSNIWLKGWLLDKKCKTSPYLHRYEWNTYLLTTLQIPREKLIPVELPCFFPQISAAVIQEIQPLSPYILLHVGGGWEYKRWQIEKWQQLVREMLYKQPYRVIVIGGKGEAEQIAQMANSLADLAKLANEKLIYKITTLEQMVALLQSCLFFVGLDSGPMNLATCLGKKVVALFGPGDSQMWYPYSPESRWIHKKQLFACNPCFQTECFFKQKNCMASIEVAEVMQAIENLL
ncbi:MAG: glycosyltransferase family 9 protein [Microscillaceae bacterium]|nr:glycosyltransferase family 9 protein [Microscillaceae bacterium]MDW8459660.1 glycosyltransferase family 9 protein [Cytophagales bacterium]